MESKTKKLRMGWIQNLTENEKKIIDDFLEEAAKLKGKALNKKEKQTVKFIARDQVRSIRKEQKSKNKRRVELIWKKKKMKQLIPYQIMRMSKED
jgi:TRAP-type C4-dicarboxylate transport system substrate-binding protein